MTNASVTMPVGHGLHFRENADVANDKKPKKPVGRPPIDEPTISVSARIPQTLFDELVALEESIRPRSSRSSIIIDALELYIAKKKAERPQPGD